MISNEPTSPQPEPTTTPQDQHSAPITIAETRAVLLVLGFMRQPAHVVATLELKRGADGQIRIYQDMQALLNEVA